MGLQLNRKYYWMADYIAHHTPTLAEIQEAWMKSSLSEYNKPLSRRTFLNMKRDIMDYLGIDIQTRQYGKEYRYIIEGDPEDNGVQSWLINTMSVRNTLEQNLSIQNRILLENVPSSSNNLDLIMEAIRENLCITFTYEDYWEDPVEVTLRPYFVRLFNQRWYVVGPQKDHDNRDIRSYSMDRERFKNFRLTSERFTFPESFDAEKYSLANFGTYREQEDICQVQIVRILVWEKQNFYLESVRLHPTQRTLYTCKEDGYSIFEYYLQPTYDFEMVLRSYGNDVEVLQPEWLRRHMIEAAKDVIKEYAGHSRESCKFPIPTEEELDKLSMMAQ